MEKKMTEKVTEKVYDIFISYRRNGGETTAVLLKSELTHLGYKVFLDFDDLPIGGNFEERIENTIKSSHLFLFLYSYGCLNRCKNEEDILRKEIDIAINNGVQILTLNVNLATKYYTFPPKNVKLPQPMLVALGRHNFLDFFTGQYKNDSLVRLAEYMATELGNDSLGFQKKKCTLALLSEIDADFVVNGKEWTALRANVIKHVQIDYGKYEVKFRPVDNYYEESLPMSVIVSSPMKEIQMRLDDFMLKDKGNDMDISKDIEGLNSEEIREKGWDYQFTGKPKLAIKCWEIAADMGDTAAQYSLGYQYSKGEYIPRNEDLAFEWFLKAARQGDSRAQFKLGDAYYYGSGTKRDYNQAVHWYKKASEQNNAKAIYSLACCYHKGHGVTADAKKAFDLFMEAAKAGYVNAELIVGRCYELGEGAAKNIDEAIKWYEKAAAQGNEAAKLYVERLSRQK